MAPRIVNCPRCGTGVEWSPDNKWRPFCSERCKMMDLGAWASESYRIPVVEESDELDAGNPDDTPHPPLN
jgi:endogenous inhibitor of DNA gyrase (YacG/DUF329 family)